MTGQVFSKRMQSLFAKGVMCALFVLAFARVSPAQYTLPLYEILIDTCYLAQLDSFPERDRYFPAHFVFESDTQECEVRYRGGAVRLLPKKSWKVRFPIVGPDGRHIYNLNADYWDNSKMRNHLAMELFRIMERPAPLSTHISMKLNGVYIGVYTNVEQVDEQFLERNGFSIGPMWKAMRHGARFSPMIDYDRYPFNYECKIDDPTDFSELQELLCFCHYSAPDEFEAQATERFDIENVLDFYAIQFAIRNLDGMSKNYYLHRYFDGSHWRMFPWDCDATFGNFWDGTWQGDFEDVYITGFSRNTLLQRLLEQEDFRNYFQLRLHELGSGSLDSLATIAQQTYHSIRHDVYLDILKPCSNEEFDSEQDSLLLFLSRRGAFLHDLDHFNRTRLDDVWVSSDWLTNEDDEITFRVRAVEPVSAIHLYLHDRTGAFQWRNVYDDGQHDDLETSDGIYGRRMSLQGIPCPLHYYFNFITLSGETYSFPANGYFSQALDPTVCLEIVATEHAPESEHLTVGPFYKIGSELSRFFFQIENTAEHEVDLSYCAVRYGLFCSRFQFYEPVIVDAGNRMNVTNCRDGVERLRPTELAIGNLFQPLAIGDTVWLESASGKVITFGVCDSFLTAAVSEAIVVVNEINYNSADDFDPEDWIELYNANWEAVSLDGWSLRDERDDHIFFFPSGIVIPAGEYLVVCEDVYAFSQHFPEAGPVVGNIDFGFGGGGDAVRLYDFVGTLADSVAYDDEPPWPTEPDGNGPTLELVNPRLDNTLYQNWRASDSTHGTPGAENSVYDWTPESPGNLPLKWSLSQNWPNPFNSATMIRYSVKQPGRVRLMIYNLLGQETATLVNRFQSPGSYTISWNAKDLPSGIYFCRMEAQEFQQTRKMLLVR